MILAPGNQIAAAGEGPKIEDVLFRWKITGHDRYYGPHAS